MPALHASGMECLLLHLFFKSFMNTHMAKETNQQPPVWGTLALGKIDCR